MTRRQFVPALGVAPAILLRGQSRIEKKGREVVDAALAALGGDVFLAMKDRRETGRAYSFYNTRMSGFARAKITTRYLMAPKPGDLNQRERQSYGRKDKDIDVAYTLYLEDGKAWDVTYRGAKEMDAELFARYKESTLHNVLYLFRMRLGEKGMIIEHRGTDVADYQPVEIVDFTDSENRVTTVNFHQSTKLPIRQKWMRRNAAKTQDEEITLFDKYRDVGGMKWPFVIQRQRNGEKQFEMFSEKVEVNLGLTDDWFSLPANVEIL